MEIHTPVLFPHISQCSLVGRILLVTPISAHMDLVVFCHRISSWKNFIIITYPPGQNYIQSWRDSTRVSVTTQYAVQFYGSDKVGFGCSITACLMVILMTSSPLMASFDPFNSTRRKYHLRYSPNRSNNYSTDEVMRCKKFNFYWR